MIAEPPNVASRAVPNLGRAAEYANYILSGSEQTAVVRISPAYYLFCTSTWNCNVRFESWNSGFTAMPYPSNDLGTASVPHNFYDGKGYDSGTLIPQFVCWRLGVRDSTSAGQTSGATNFHINLLPTEISFKKSAEFKGGFCFLGLAETIKWIADSANETEKNYRAQQFVFSYGGSWAGTATQVNGLTYSSTTSTNVNQLLSSIRTATGFTGYFSAYTSRSVLDIQSRATDSIQLKDCIFGPGIPSHKDVLGGDRHPYINVRSNAKIYLSNVYLRGNTVITSSGIGCSSAIENSNVLHYGASNALVEAPWTFKQFHHTFIGTTGDLEGSLFVDMVFGMIGFYYSVLIGSSSIDRNFYSDLTGKPLPNHIHLITNSSTSNELNYPSNDNDGPFLDQLIHAKTSITIESFFVDVFAFNTTVPVRSGFMGRFGSNGHNQTKSRGILLGCRYFGKEGGTISQTDISQYGTIFRRAGAINTTFVPYVQDPGNSTNYGEGYPAGPNPVITTRDNGSTTVNLNMGARSWRAGISPQYGSIVRPDKSENITI
jgi:peptidoglycan hydrolase-like protein with peptidoglycan-binding domain